MIAIIDYGMGNLRSVQKAVWGGRGGEFREAFLGEVVSKPLPKR